MVTTPDPTAPRLTPTELARQRYWGRLRLACSDFGDVHDVSMSLSGVVSGGTLTWRVDRLAGSGASSSVLHETSPVLAGSGGTAPLDTHCASPLNRFLPHARATAAHTAALARRLKSDEEGDEMCHAALTDDAHARDAYLGEVGGVRSLLALLGLLVLVWWWWSEIGPPLITTPLCELRRPSRAVHYAGQASGQGYRYLEE